MWVNYYVFINSRTIKNKKYYYLEDDLSIYGFKKRFSVFLNGSVSFIKFQKTFNELRNKVIIESAKVVKNKFKPKILNSSELVELEKLKYNYKLFKKYLKDSYLSFDEDQFIRFVQGSASVEGNSISLQEATLIIKDKISIEGKTIDEIKEIENLKNTKQIIDKKPKITEKTIKKIHKQVMEGFNSKFPGEYRDGPVYITGARIQPPAASRVPGLLKELIEWYDENKSKMHTIELTSYFHSKFESIHPFRDGNGRVGRELLNLILIENGYPRIIINLKNRASYINILEKLHYSKENIKFSDFTYNCLLERAKIIEKTINEHKEVIYKKIKK